MAGLMNRTALIIKSKYSKLLNRAENPTETLDYSYEQMLEQLQNMKRGVADVVTSKKRIELQQQKLEQNVVKLETQARQAVAANREDLAPQALQRKAVAQQQLQDMDAQVKQLEDQQEKLIDAQQQLETKIESFRSQKEVLKAQYSAAEAQVKVGEAATGIGEHMNDTGMAIQRAKDKTEEMQARASARSTSSRRAARSRTSPPATRRSSTASSRRSPPSSRSTTSSRSSRPRSAPASRRRRSQPERPSRPRRSARPRRAEPAAPPAEERPAVLTQLGDILFGRKKLKEPAAERLFALSTAAVTLDTECSLKPAGDSALIFKPMSAGEFTSTENDAEELLRSVAQGSGSEIDRKTDSFGFEWVIVRDPQLDDQVAGVHALASELEQHGFGGQLLAAAFRFDGGDVGRQRARLLDLRLQDRNVVAVHPDRRETGAGQRQRARAEGEAREELPIEPDLSKWLALFDAPI